MSRIEELTVAGWRRGHGGTADREVHRDPAPELGTRIVGGLGVLLLSPTVVTAASRCRLGSDSKPEALLRRTPGDLRTRIAVIASGLVAAASLVYTAPGMPWASDVLTASAGTAIAAGSGSEAAMDLGHNGATNFGKIVRTAESTVLIDATPATAGINTVAVTVLDSKDVPAKVEQWAATATLPGSGLPPVTLPLAAFGAGVAAADAQLPFPGDWTFTFTIKIAGADSTTFTQIVPIAEHS